MDEYVRQDQLAAFLAVASFPKAAEEGRQHGVVDDGISIDTCSGKTWMKIEDVRGTRRDSSKNWAEADHLCQQWGPVE